MIQRIHLLTMMLFLFAEITGNERHDKLTDVIIINSYHTTFKWTQDLTNAIIKELPEKDNYRLFVEYMDTKKFHTQPQLEAFKDYMFEKYKGIDVQGIICSDNHAMEFILKYGDELFGKVPVVFCGVNNIRDFNIDTTRYRGVAEDIDIRTTLRIIETVQPNLEELIVISDSTLSGLLFSDQFKSALEPDFLHLNYEIIYATTPLQLKNQLSAFPEENRAIYLLSLYLDRDGSSRDIILEADFIRESLDVPVYGNWDFLFGNFIVGGSVINGTDQGIEAGKAMRKILTGKADQVPFLKETPQHIIFDYIQLKRYDLIIPQKSNISFINRPENLFRKHQRTIIIGGSILIFLVTAILILLHILNQKRIIEKRLRKSENRLELALEGSYTGLWDIDFENKTIYLNKRLSRFLGYVDKIETDFNIKMVRNLFHPEDIDQIREAFIMHVNGTNRGFHGEFRLKTDDGEYGWHSVHGRVTEFNDANRPVRMVGILTDINFQKEFENELHKARNRALESDRLKSAFLANMSHEIRTPMNAIIGFSDIILKEKMSSKEAEKYLKMILKSGESLLNLINDIIDISKIESGQIQIKPETFDLHTLLQNIEMVAKTLITSKKKNIAFVVKKGNTKKNFFIESDPHRIEQVIYNLINNAIKFTNSGSIELAYFINNDRQIEFSVTDTGVGIALEDQSVIFERFRQAENGDHHTAGTGLGLAISKSLVELIGGEIFVESEPKKGSCFRFVIPCRVKSQLSGIHF
ncbi:sensor histidine kinase [Natronoflexus pectinivorans]|nr:PAS domain-containing protein [Natronoflexus pectinivorans]